MEDNVKMYVDEYRFLLAVSPDNRLTTMTLLLLYPTLHLKSQKCRSLFFVI